MNPTLRKSANDILKRLLYQCDEDQQLVFKRMYANGKLEMHIDDVVDKMSDEKIDWAISQCERTVDKNIKKLIDG